MLLQVYQRIRHDWVQLVSYSGVSLTLEILLAIVVPWTLWYIYAFVLKPYFNPKSPKELPYRIPVLGHALTFLKNAQELVDYGRHYFGNSKKPFTVTVGGQKLYILTSPQDVAAVYKNNVTLSWDEMLNQLLTGFGVSEQVVSSLWAKLPKDVLRESRPDLRLEKIPHLSLVHSTLDLYKRQLLPGPKGDHFNHTLISYIDKSLTFEQVTKTYLLEKRPGIEHLSLMHLCGEVLISAVTKTLFGPVIYQIEPELTRYIIEFNQDSWMLVFQVPQKANSKLNVARNKILAAFSQYLRLPSDQHEGQSYLIRSLLHETGAISVPDTDRAAMMLMVFWAANINPTNMAFWMLSYIFFDPKLQHALKEETAPAFDRGQMDVSYLVANCPQLDAVYNETLRITNGALSGRKITATTKLGNTTLEAGNTIIIPFRQLSYNTDVFGDDPGRFDPTRFLKDANLINSSSFRPFGGGVNYCPGRFIAKQEMMAITALLLHRFHSSLSRSLNQQFPELDIQTPALGINGPKRGQDVLIDLAALC